MHTPEKKTNDNLAKEPAKAQKNIKNLGGMVSSDGKPTVTINAMPDELNQFFARFEKP